MRICPKCGKKYRSDQPDRCMMSYGQPAVKCETVTEELIDWTDEDEAMAQKDLEEGELSDPFEDYDEDEPEPVDDSKEDLRGQADQIHDLLEIFGSLTYKELAEQLNPPVTPTRASRLVGQMIRDGVELKREGKPRKVSLA